jgi:hypothetical protein
MASDDTKSVTLPKDPGGADFEDYVCAYLQAAGLYTDRSVTERGDAEILELDIISSDYKANSPPEKVLFEAKAGDWGMPDVFKVKGWISYLDIARGVFVVREGRQHEDYYIKKASEMDIRLIVINDLDQMQSRLTGALGIPEVEPIVRDLWRFAFLTERKTLSLIKKRKREKPDLACYRALDQYLFTINSRIFFSPTALGRVDDLYDEFKKTPNLSAKCIHEINGGDFNDDCEQVAKEAFEDCNYHGKINDLALTTYAEHRARLAILKGAVDYLLYKNSGKGELAEQAWTIRLSGFQQTFSQMNMLPRAFREAVEGLAKDEYFYRYPIVWQWFTLFFGGFLLKDRLDDEYAALGRLTGTPASEIPKALACYDSLFPIGPGKSWFVDVPKTSIRKVQMFPIQFAGIGALARRMLNGGKEYRDLGLSGQYTTNDLIKWNNAAVEIHHL